MQIAVRLVIGGLCFAAGVGMVIYANVLGMNIIDEANKASPPAERVSFVFPGRVERAFNRYRILHPDCNKPRLIPVFGLLGMVLFLFGINLLVPGIL